MKISELAESLGFEKVALPRPELEACGGYAGDLLSWVMGRAEEGNVWVTIMTNINVIAVASLAGVSAVVVAEGAEIDGNITEKAMEQGINLLRTPKPIFEAVLAVGRELGM